MANTSDQSNLFDLLKEYDVEFSPQLKLLLTKLKYDSVRTLSMIDCDRLEDFEKDVRLVVAADDQLANMTREHKIALFGDYFADKPQQFKLLAGEKCCLKAAVGMCLKLLQSYEKSYTFDKFPSVQELNKKKRKLQKNQRLQPTNTTTDNQGTSLQVPVQVAVRKGKTLRQYIENWLLATKLKLSVTSADFDIIEDKIKCTKCSNRPFKVSGDERVGWKICSYMNHLRLAHQKPEEAAAHGTGAVNEGNTSVPRDEIDQANAATLADETEPLEKRQRTESDFPASAPISSQSTSNIQQ